MTLSKTATQTLLDLVENKLASLQIGDREDLRELMTLQTCLGELRGLCGIDAPETRGFIEIPTRGRRRKMADLMEDMKREKSA